MGPQNLNYGGGVAETVVNPTVLVVVVMTGLLILLLPRRKALFPFLIAGILIPLDQVLVVGSLHFPMLRVIAFFGILRMAWAKVSGKGKIFSGGMNGIDWAAIVLTTAMGIDGVLLWRASGEIVYQVGNIYTAFGIYFFMRYTIQNEEDVNRVFKALTFVIVVVAVFMTFEYFTGQNLFYKVLAGADAAVYSNSVFRGGHFRAAGCFRHPILAGTFAGFVFPLLVGWWRNEKKDRTYAAIGLLSAVIIPFTTGSSTALFALLAGIGALFLWPLRRRLRFVRWGIVVTLIAGQFYMKSPLWHLIDDVSLSADSSSYHRFQLVNQCILHFGDWILVGTKNYASWGWDMWDLSNQYVFTADTAGLIPLIALICILVFGFKYIGRARKMAEGDKSQEFLIWAVGASLFANLVAFWGISYFDQTIVPWYALLAIISAVTLPARSAETVASNETQNASLNAGFPASRPGSPAWPANPTIATFRTPQGNLTTRPR